MKSKYLLNKIFDAFPIVRYVAIYSDNTLIKKQRNELDNSSSSESDKYEELFINPGLITLARQRGNLDCGGLQFLVVAYGNFYQLVKETKRGHISICLDKKAEVTCLATKLNEFITTEAPEFLV